MSRAGRCVNLGRENPPTHGLLPDPELVRDGLRDRHSRVMVRAVLSDLPKRPILQGGVHLLGRVLIHLDSQGGGIKPVTVQVA